MSTPPPPRRLFRPIALAEAVTWTLLLLAMATKYLLNLGAGELAVRVAGGVHGFVFLAYCLSALLIAVDRGWRPAQLLAAWASAVVPYLTIPFERYAEQQGLLPDRWRLAAEDASGPAESTVAVALRRPLTAAAVAVLVLTVVFSGLLALGPPTEWFS